MRRIQPYLSHPIFISVTCVLVFMGVVFFIQSAAQKQQLTSPPSTVRPWAEADFLRLTKPVPSPGKPTDPQYLARNSGSSPASSPNYAVKVAIDFPSIEYVPSYELIEFDMQDGFTAKAGSGEIRWIAAKPYDLPADPNEEPKFPFFTPRNPNGSLMGDDEVSFMNFEKHELRAWGYEINGHFGSAMKGCLKLNGFENFQCKFQGVFDANTHVVLTDAKHLNPKNDGVNFGLSLAAVHDAPLLAVMDVAHGHTQDFTMPIAKGATISQADFSVEIIEVLEGSVYSASTTSRSHGKTIDVEYSKGESKKALKTFSVIYQINPLSMTNAISLDAIDAAGKLIQNQGRFMENAAPVSKFSAPLATAASLQVRYRPHQTRLIIKMKSLPGVTAPNINPIDLFDVRVPQVTFADPFAMRRFIASGTQLKNITGSLSRYTLAAFPMTLTNVSPRQVAERYLALDGDRRIKIDPSALTLEFEQPKKSTWFSKTWTWLKSLW